MAPQPTNWLSDFKTRPDIDNPMDVSLDEHYYTYDIGDRRLAPQRQVDSGGQHEVDCLSAGFWCQHQLYEAGSAAWDTVLRRHRLCAATEWHARMLQYDGFELKCPVAAAGLRAFTELDVATEPLGDWQTSHQNRDFHGGRRFRFAQETPQSYHRFLLQDVARAWLLDALLVLGDAVAAERKKVFWACPPTSQSKTTLSGGALSIAGKVSITQLEAAVDLAEQHCKVFRTRQ